MGMYPKCVSSYYIKEKRKKREEGGRVPAHRLDGSLERTGSDLAPGSLWGTAVRGGPPEEAALAPNKERGGGKEPEDVFRGRVTCWPGKPRPRREGVMPASHWASWGWNPPSAAGHAHLPTGWVISLGWLALIAVPRRVETGAPSQGWAFGVGEHRTLGVLLNYWRRLAPRGPGSEPHRDLLETQDWEKRALIQNWLSQVEGTWGPDCPNSNSGSAT